MGATVRILKNDFPRAPGMMRAGVSAAFHSVGPRILSSVQQRTPVDTGQLRASEDVTYPDELRMQFSAGKGLPDDRAVYVHQGTYKMGARPFLTSAVEDALPDVEQALVSQLQSALQ